MKIRFYIWLSAWAFVSASWGNVCLCDEKTVKGYPSELLGKNSADLLDARMFLHEKHDLRLMFCDLETLKERIKRNVCVLDRIGFNQIPVEISIGRGKSIKQIIVSIGLKSWKGGHPQLRIVSRNAIIQSALRDDIQTDRPPIDKILKVKVAAGDFVIISLAD